jgi:hypothetical protein
MDTIGHQIKHTKILAQTEHLVFRSLGLLPGPQSVASSHSVPQSCGFGFKRPERGSRGLGPRLHASSRVLRAGLSFFFFFFFLIAVTTSLALRASEAEVAAPRAEDSLCPPHRGGSAVPTPGARLRRALNRGNGPRTQGRAVSPAGDRPDAEARAPLTCELWPPRTLAPRGAFGFSLALRTRSHTSTVLPPPR